MAVSLETAKRRERESKSRPAPILPASAYMLTGAELARECASAVRAYPPSRALTDAERDALAAMLAATVTERMGRGRTRAQVKRNGASRTAVQVLRYVDRCERFPALMAGREGIPRSAVGREYLMRECASIMRDSREWRDTAESYQTATERQTATGPMIRNVDTATESDALTVAAARECERTTGEPLPALPLDTADVSDAMALALMAEGGPRESVAVALRASAAPLPSVALALGVSLRTAERRRAQGAKWLRENVPAPALLALMREAADALGHVVPADPNAAVLPASAATACAAIDRAARQYRPSGQTALPGGVDGASTRDLRTIAGRVAETPTTWRVSFAPLPLMPRQWPAPIMPRTVLSAERVADVDARPLGPDAAPFPAASRYRVAVEAFRAAGHEWPATAAAKSVAGRS